MLHIFLVRCPVISLFDLYQVSFHAQFELFPKYATCTRYPDLVPLHLRSTVTSPPSANILELQDGRLGRQ